LGYHKSTSLYKALSSKTPADWIYESGTMAMAFPATSASAEIESFNIEDNLVSLSKNFNVGVKLSSFQNSGVFINGRVHTAKTSPIFEGKRIVLGDILENYKVPDEFYIPEDEFPKWEYLKGAKKETRTAKSGFSYNYSEGSMIFPDALNNASRTIITGEGGKSPSRFKHVVQTNKGLRRLTPVELERLNMFPNNHTALEGISNTKRAFFMGNALVVGVVQRLGKALFDKINSL
jgi:DNA (cytosine-5)-methyltransferase 1